MNGKTGIFFGPPLAVLTADEKNTLEVSGRINRTAERYLATLAHHTIPLNAAEIACIKAISEIGFMSIEEIEEIPLEVELFNREIEGLDKKVLLNKLRATNFAEKVAIVEAAGC